MNCTEAREVLSAILDGEAVAAESEMLAGHLASCLSCRRYQLDLKADRELLLAWPDESSAAGSSARSAQPQRRHRATVAALILLSLGVGFFAGRASRRPVVPLATEQSVVTEAPAVPSTRFVVYPSRHTIALTTVLPDAQPAPSHQDSRHD